MGAPKDKKEKADKPDKKSVQARFDEFVEYVRMELERQGRRLLYTGGLWHEYKAGYWTPWSSADKDAANTMLHRLASLHEFSYSTQKAAIWSTLEAALGSEVVIEFDAVPAIVCRSNTYFVAANQTKKHSHTHYATRRVDIDVDPDATCPQWLAMLDRMFDDYSATTRAETIKFLKEWMGVAIVGGASVQNSRDMRKGLFLYGEKRTGKSSIADVLIRLLGGLSRIAAPSLTSLSKDFGLQPLIGKSALITSEAADTRTVADSNTLKNLITGDPIQINVKHRDPIPFQWHGPVMFTTNNLPKIADETDALYDRTVIIEFTRQFGPEDVAETLEGYPNVIMYLEAKGELPGILNWCLDGYDDAVERGRLFIPPSASSATEKFRRKNDPVFDFLKSCCVYDKGKACAAEAVTAACVEFAQMRHDVKISQANAARSVARSIKSVLPGVLHEMAYHDKTQFRAYSKMRLNETGVQCLELAQTKPNLDIKQTIKRTNYRYG